MQRGFYKECYTYGKWGENLPFSGNDVDLMTGNRIPFCTSSSLLARTEIFLSSAAIGKNNPWLTIWFTDEVRFIYLIITNIFSASYFFKSIEGSMEEKGKITHTMRQPRIYPISFSVSTSRVWRVYRGLKICFSSRGVVSAPQSPNCSFAMPPHFVFSLQQGK